MTPPPAASPADTALVELWGLLTNRYGEPATGTRVRLTGAPGAFEATAEFVDGAAQYLLRLPAGVYDLTASHADGEYRGTLWLASPRAELSLTLRPPDAPSPTRAPSDGAVTALDFRDPQVIAQCRPLGQLTALMATQTGLRLSVAERLHAGIEVPLALDAARANTIELTLRYIPSGGLGRAFVAWVCEGETDEHRLEFVKQFTPGRESVTSYRRALSAGGGWRGRIRGLRVYPGQHQFEVQRIAFQQVSFEGMLRAAGDLLNAVTIAGERRPAIHCPPPGAVSRRLEVPAAGARLRVGCALHSLGTDPGAGVRFVAEVRGKCAAIVVDRALTARDGGWQDASADLTLWAGETVELHLRTELAAPGACAPFWSEPEVIPAARRAARPNVILISLDALRRDRVGCFSGRPDLTPHLDRLAAAGAAFARAWATSRWTLGSHAAIFTGRYQIALGDTTTRLHIPADQPTLTDLFAAQGYACAGFVGGGFVEPPFGFGRGCRSYALARGDEVFERAQAWIADHAPEPFCLFLHTFDVHDFFDESERVRALYFGRMEFEPLPPADREALAQAYEARVRRVDARVGALLEFLRGRGLFENTIVVVFGDHGDGLGEHGHVGHSGTLTMWEETIAVPLLIKPAGSLEPRIIDAPVSLVDVLPTVMELAGQPAPADCHGRSLLPLLRGGTLSARADFVELQATTMAVRDGDHKLVALMTTHPLPRGPFLHCYDLAADPGERHNLADERPEAVARLLGLLREWAAMHQRGIRLRVRNGDAVAHTVAGTLSAEVGLQFVVVPPIGPGDRVSLTPFDEPVHFRLSLEPGEERLVVFDARSDPTIALAADGRPLAVGAVRGPDGGTLGVGPLTLGAGISYDRLLAPAPPAPPRDAALTVTVWHQEPERSRGAAAETDIPAEVRERLAALGYI